jgi:hypothetical protein
MVLRYQAEVIGQFRASGFLSPGLDSSKSHTEAVEK